MKKLLAPSLAILLAGCASFGEDKLPATLGERAASYGYVPLDPLPIEMVGYATSCQTEGASSFFVRPDESKYLPLTQALPDVAVRFAVAEYKAGVGLEFGPSAITTKRQSYRAILDYVNSDSVTIKLLIRKIVLRNGQKDYVSLMEPINDPSAEKIIGYQAQLVPDKRLSIEKIDIELDQFQKSALNGGDKVSTNGWQAVAFPVYVGVGFRLTADFQALEGNLSLGGLSSIGASADAKKLSGSMTLQSIGVNGLGTTTALALPNKLDQTTIEQSILAIGTGRALIYTDSEESKVRLSPRVIGLYSPVGSDPRLINAVYSELSTIRLAWPRPCKE